MARGRKPIPRTREEAQAVRREQVRRNVQAFRQRQNASEPGTEGKSENDNRWIFVQEDLTSTTTDDSSEHHSQGTLRQFASEEVTSVAESDGQSSAPEPCCPNKSSTADSQHLKLGSQKRARTYRGLPPGIDSTSASRQQFIASSAQIFLPGDLVQSGRSMDLGPHWAQALPHIINKRDFLDISVQALCLLQIAHTKQERWLVEASRSYYGQALQRLNFALSYSKDTFQHGVFATSLVLSTYELFNGTTGGQGVGWKFHLQGASSYLTRFPSHDSLRSILSHQMSFHFLETVCIFDALRSRKASSLTHSHWWDKSLNMFGGSTYGPLLRLVTLLPPLLEQSDILASSKSSVGSFETGMLLLDRALSLEDQLTGWLNHTNTMLSDFWYKEVTARTAATALSTNEQSEITYPSLFVARLYLIYWSSIIALNSVTSSVTKKLRQNAAGAYSSPCALHSSVLLKKMHAKSDNFASNIRKSINFCLKPSNGLVGKSIMLLPLWFAKLHFDHQDREEARFCVRVLQELGQDDSKFGLAVGL